MRKKTEIWFRENRYYTKVELEGFVIWDGKSGIEKPQPRLFSTLIEEVDVVPESDKFILVTCDIQVFVYNGEDELQYKQLGKLSVRKIKNDYCGSVIEEKGLIQVHKPASLDLERLERDNNIIRNIQSKFEDYINRTTTITYKPDTKEFDSLVLSFIKEIEKIVTGEDIQRDFVYKCYLDKDPLDILSIDSLDNLKVWKEFKSEIFSYDYSYSATEEFIFDLDFQVLIPTIKKEEEILRYIGTLSIELDSPIKTNLVISLKSKKLNTTIDRDYIPKRTVNRFSDLDI